MFHLNINKNIKTKLLLYFAVFYFICFCFVFAKQAPSKSNNFQNIPSKAEEVSPLLIGEKVPDIEVISTEGKKVSIKKIVAKKKTLLIFYRGGWCPFCNLHLGEINSIQKKITKMGYQIVAISPDSFGYAEKSEKSINYEIYSDASGKLMSAMGIAFQASNYKKKLNKRSNLLNSNSLLPVPSVFVLSPSSKILFEYISPNYTHRIKRKLLLSVLENF